jgi:hypothetical protein
MKFVLNLLCSVAILLSSITATHAQFTDSIMNALRQKPRAYVALNNRNSFIQNQKAPVNGVKLGLNFKSQFIFGLSYNWMPKGIAYYNEKQSLNELKLHYVSAFAEYTFYNTKRWEIAIPLQVGIGNIYTQQHGVKTAQSTAFFYEPTMSCTWKPTRYVGLGLDVGYRIVTKNDKQIGQNFTSPTYSFGVAFFFGAMYSDAKEFFIKNK